MVVIGKGGTQAGKRGKSKDRARSHLGPALAGTDRLLRPTDRVRGVDEAAKMCDPGVHRQSVVVVTISSRLPLVCKI